MNSKDQRIELGSIQVGVGCRPFIIAEMSGNHNQSLEKALQIVEAAAKTGAHALKLQTYTADSITIDHSEGEFFISDSQSLWKGQSLYSLYKKACTPYDWHEPIFNRAKELGMLCFSTPFDEEAVDFLMQFNPPCFKVASFENNHLPLIRKIASTGKPLIISTGMATQDEIEDSVETARQAGCKDLILLKCTSSYPSSPKDTNILTIPDMRDRFDVQVGLSDHTLGIGVSVASVALGATVIEKHFTLDRGEGGVDSAFSMEPHEMKALVEESERAWLSLGQVSYGPTQGENKSLVFRRSIYVTEDIEKGEAFSLRNVRIIRPGLGLKPKFFDQVLNSKAKRDLKRGTALSLDDLS